MITTTVQRDGRIEIHAPEFAEGQLVEVFVCAVQDQQTRKSAFDLLPDYPGGVLFKSAEDVDAFVRMERGIDG